MKKLKLPKLKKSAPAPQLSMDEYLNFVMFNLKHAKPKQRQIYRNQSNQNYTRFVLFERNRVS